MDICATLDGLSNNNDCVCNNNNYTKRGHKREWAKEELEGDENDVNIVYSCMKFLENINIHYKCNIYMYIYIFFF